MSARAIAARARAGPPVLVVKVGGGTAIDMDAVCADLATRTGQEPIVVLHGASKELDRVSTAMGHPPVRLQSASGIESRFTDDATMEIFSMVYAGRANPKLVERLQRLGVNAVGLCGIDGGLLRGPEKGTLRARLPDGREQVIRGDRSGTVAAVNGNLLRLLLDGGYVPVLSPPALSDHGRAMNVDGDRAAAQVAMALGAETLVILSDVPGLLLDPANPDSIVSDVRPHEIGRAMEVARGRMRVKVMAAREALKGGVSRVVVGDGRVARPVELALHGGGTVFRRRGVARAGR